jgi:hypothetical protein
MSDPYGHPMQGRHIQRTNAVPWVVVVIIAVAAFGLLLWGISDSYQVARIAPDATITDCPRCYDRAEQTRCTAAVPGSVHVSPSAGAFCYS